MACADYIEVDVRLSYDGVPVIIHDARVDRTTSRTGQVNDLTLKELKRT
jgi:glycerophosphoryl diester phosphodiesterase